MWTSPKYDISESIKIPGLTDINNIIYNLYKQLLNGLNRYIVYTDNFFTSVDLYNILKDIGVSAIDTTKIGSFPAELLTLTRSLKKQKHGVYKP